MDSGSVVSLVYAHDPDVEDMDAFRFDFPPPHETGDTDNHMFQFDGNELKFLAVGDYETDSVYTIHIGVLDPGDSLYTKIFTLKLLDRNDPVIVSGAVTTPQTVDAGQAYSYTYPEDLFYDQDESQDLTVTASLEDDSPLPGWLAFDAGSRTFAGTPSDADADSLVIKIKAEDPEGSFASVTFGLKVESTSAIRNSGGVEFLVYPNPASEYTMIRFQDMGVEPTLRLYNITGECVKILDHPGISPCRIDLKGLAPGIYLLELRGNTSKKGMLRIE